MDGFVKHFRFGRFAWTVLVAFYFIVFFRNLFGDVLPGSALIPYTFSLAFVLWLSVEYYFGSPFFQSGVVEPSALWRGVFGFFVYPLLGYVAGDLIWWHYTQLPIPPVIGGVIGVLVFAAGTYLRLSTLFGLLRVVRVKQGQGKQPPQVVISEEKFLGLRYQKLSRHPRYLATFIQLAGAALAFNSWGGLLLVLVVGLPLILVQVHYEDARLSHVLKTGLSGYLSTVPVFLPRLRG